MKELTFLEFEGELQETLCNKTVTRVDHIKDGILHLNFGAKLPAQDSDVPGYEVIVFVDGDWQYNKVSSHPLETDNEHEYFERMENLAETFPEVEVASVHLVGEEVRIIFSDTKELRICKSKNGLLHLKHNILSEGQITQIKHIGFDAETEKYTKEEIEVTPQSE